MTPEDEQRHDPKAAPTWKKTFDLLTELPEASSQFGGHSGSVLATVRAHG
jgi:hypothetical protein